MGQLLPVATTDNGLFATAGIIGRLKSGMAWSLSGTVLSKACSLLGTVVIARSIGAHRFGELAMILTTVGMAGTLAGFGLGTATTKEVAACRRREKQKADEVIAFTIVTAVIMGAAMGLALALLAPWISRLAFGAPQIESSLRISSITLFLNAVIGVQIGALAGHEQFRVIAKVNCVTGALAAACSIVGALAGGVSGVLWGTNLGLLAWLAINQFALRQFWSIRIEDFRISSLRRHAPLLTSFCVPSVLGGLMVSPATWVTSTIVAHAHGGYQDLAVLGMANQWRNAILFVPAALGSAAMPILADLRANDHTQQSFFHLLFVSIKASAALSLLTALPIILLAKPISAAYGSAFAGGYSVLILTVIASVVVAVNNQFSRAMLSAGRTWVSFGFDTAWGIAFVGTSLLLVPSSGARGAALALLVATLVQCASQWIYVVRWLNPAVAPASSPIEVAI